MSITSYSVETKFFIQSIIGKGFNPPSKERVQSLLAWNELCYGSEALLPQYFLYTTTQVSAKTSQGVSFYPFMLFVWTIWAPIHTKHTVLCLEFSPVLSQAIATALDLPKV